MTIPAFGKCLTLDTLTRALQIWEEYNRKMNISLSISLQNQSEEHVESEGTEGKQ